jgi:outer membrane lipoprotein SlyB
MVLPILLSAAGGVLGAILPGMISAIAGAKTEDQARVALEPKREGAIIRLMGQGMTRAAASQQVDEALKGEIEKEMNKGALPPWAEMGLSLIGGLGGGALGGKLGKALSKKALKAESASAAPGAPAAPATSGRKITYRKPDTKGQDLPLSKKRDDFFPEEMGPFPSSALSPQERGLSLPPRGFTADFGPASSGRIIRDAEFSVPPRLEAPFPRLAYEDPIPELPPGLLPKFADHAAGMRAADLADIARRMNRY